ncbi:MAG: lytic transglycosylase domain-containing protein [Cytophagaceae bacterium]|nr:lytic transglycosylase domain-containing protein [Cytophagaceae bacterium]
MLILIVCLLTGSSVPATDSLENKSFASFGQSYNIYAPPVPEKLSFAGEYVPLNKTYVRESYDREVLVNTYWQSQTLLLLKRANRYFPVIEPILKAHKIPEDFKYLALCESGFMSRAVSSMGAAGIWQFMKGAAQDYGLEVSNEIDERYHIEKATEAACKYLNRAYAKYGSWTLAAAAYNAGSAGIDRQLAIQKVKNYYDLLLGEETGRYVFRILALKQIVSMPSEHGFHVAPPDLYPPIPFREVEVNGAIKNFTDFAQEYGITYRELKDLNPWLRDTCLTNSSKKSYFIKIPEQSAFTVKGSE